MATKETESKQRVVAEKSPQPISPVSISVSLPIVLTGHFCQRTLLEHFSFVCTVAHEHTHICKHTHANKHTTHSHSSREILPPKFLSQSPILFYVDPELTGSSLDKIPSLWSRFGFASAIVFAFAISVYSKSFACSLSFLLPFIFFIFLSIC